LAVLFTVSVTCFSNPITQGNGINNDSYAIKNEKCKVEVLDVYKAVSFGYLAGYTVEFKNNSTKVVDGIWWTVNYLNNAKLIARTPRIKGASKVEIIITKVHFTDGSSCQ
jgi:capsule polysaccharide export protein KpsC/LpsZ